MRGSKYILRDGTIRGFCSRCGSYFKLSELDKRKGRYFCKTHNCQVRLKSRRRRESKIVRF